MIASSIFSILIIIALILIVRFLDKKHNLLRDTSTAKVKPYSFSRVQLLFWFLIILSSYIHVIFCQFILPEANESILILLGLTSSTMCASKLVDSSDDKEIRHQNEESKGLFLDILTNNGGVSMLRLQAVVFNLLFGAYFVYATIKSDTLPLISMMNLGLIGISSGSYVLNKTIENK